MDGIQSAGPLEIAARMRASSLIGMTVLEGVYAYFMIFSIVACLHPVQRPYANDVVLGLLAVFLFSMLVMATRVPYKTMLSGDTLTTYSLRGKKRISIHNVAKVKPVVFLVGKGNGLWCLK